MKVKPRFFQMFRCRKPDKASTHMFYLVYSNMGEVLKVVETTEAKGTPKTFKDLFELPSFETTLNERKLVLESFGEEV